MKGLVTFFVNFVPEKGPTADDLIQVIRENNKELIQNLKNEGYEIMYVPVTGESSRVEVVDFKGLK